MPVGVPVFLPAAMIFASIASNSASLASAPSGAHVGTQIDGADEDGIDAGQTVNRFGIGDAGGAFGLQHDQNFFVGLFEIIAGGRGKIQTVHAAAETAVAHRRIFCGGDDFPGLLDGIDHRRDNAPRAGIQRPLDEKVISLRHARKAHNRRRQWRRR